MTSYDSGASPRYAGKSLDDPMTSSNYAVADVTSSSGRGSVAASSRDYDDVVDDYGRPGDDYSDLTEKRDSRLVYENDRQSPVMEQLKVDSGRGTFIGPGAETTHSEFRSSADDNDDSTLF